MANGISDIHSGASDDEIATYIREIKARCPSDSGVAARLAQILASSGEFIEPSQAFSADVASTGGPSSLSTLLCPLYLRAAGAAIPKLGVPGRPAGGIDCLHQIPGYKSTLDAAEVRQVIDKAGYAHFLATGRLAPLDGRMFQLRKKHGCLEVPTLVTASLLSKKLAVGVKYAGLEIRVAPHGNFGSSWHDAKNNAKTFISAASLLSIEARPVLTDARYPYQPFIGRSEAILALQYVFSDRAPTWLQEHLILCRDLAISCTPLAHRTALTGVSPEAIRDYFAENLSAQGSNYEAFEALAASTAQKHVNEIVAPCQGYTRINLEALRAAMVKYQESLSSTVTMAQFPDPIGIILHVRAGQFVERGDLLATVRVDSDTAQSALSELKNCFACGEYPAAIGIEGVPADE